MTKRLKVAVIDDYKGAKVVDEHGFKNKYVYKVISNAMDEPKISVGAYVVLDAITRADYSYATFVDINDYSKREYMYRRELEPVMSLKKYKRQLKGEN